MTSASHAPGSALAHADGLALQRVHGRAVLKVVKVLVRQRLLRLHSGGQPFGMMMQRVNISLTSSGTCSHGQHYIQDVLLAGAHRDALGGVVLKHPRHEVHARRLQRGEHLSQSATALRLRGG